MPKSSPPPPLDSLVDLACRDGVDIRPTLLRVLTDLYVQKPSHTADEEIQYVELVLGLIAAVDAPTRAAVAASLRNYRAAPAAVLRKLAATDALAAKEPATHERVDVPPAQRAPATADLVELFFAAPREERRLILANLDVAENTPRHPSPAASDVISRLETAALQRNPSEFRRILEQALGIGRALAERVVGDISGEPLVVAARALGMKAVVLQRILLFLNPAIGQSVQQVYDLAQLFDELPPQSAAHMVAIWQSRGEWVRPSHEPVHWDDERRSARSLSSPADRHVGRDRDQQPGQSKTGER